MKKILSPMEKMDFPESEELPEGVREIEAEDTFGYCTELYTDVEYAVHSGKKLHLQIMTPTVFGQDLKWPLIVYVQGSSWHKQNLFQSLIQDGQQNKAGIERFYQMQGWDRKRWCVIAILKKNNNSAGSYGYHMRALSIHFPEILFCMNPGEQGEGIVCLLTLEDDRGKISGNRYGRIYPKEFFDMVRRLNFRWFLSYPCQGLENISIQYQQAKAALKEEKEDYYFCALQDLVGFGKDETLRRLALHPALDRIRAYDRKKSTDYYHMLKVYLQCERERVLTSRKLFVHKNTLVYRLKKMVSLFALQLDEIYEREYLMASFLCLEQEEKAE